MTYKMQTHCNPMSVFIYSKSVFFFSECAAYAASINHSGVYIVKKWLQPTRLKKETCP